MYFNKNMGNAGLLTFSLCYNQIYVCKKQKQRKMKGTSRLRQQAVERESAGIVSMK